MVDYSKWKDIEVSDDEDDTHPNIDTGSLFRWRHQARIERMEEQKREKESFETKRRLNEQKQRELRDKIKNSGDAEQLKKDLEALEKEAQNLRLEEENLKKKEKLTPWNVDTISKPGFEKTVINRKITQKEYDEMTDEEKEQHLKDFVKKNEKEMKQYGMMRKYEDSRNYLREHHYLVCEDTANYLVIWCINLEMEGKHELMTHIAHQTICMQYILELGRQLDVDPRGCIISFFDRIQVADIEYRRQFEDEIKAFISRIEKRAKEKLEAALKEQEEEERQARLGPGGLDPEEVFPTLPPALQECFEKRDTELLKKVISEMDENEAKYHMKRCVDSGLWVADASTLQQTEEQEKKDDLDLD
jgi:cell division cycle protein 37